MGGHWPVSDCIKSIQVSQKWWTKDDGMKESKSKNKIDDDDATKVKLYGSKIN